MSSDSTGQVIATGTQDLAALAGLFCTDSVERNVLTIENGYGSVAASGLSMLGLLGLVRSTIKITLGLDRCRVAGFISLDSLRGLFGYNGSETPIGGDKFDCSSIDVQILQDEVIIKKAQRSLDDFTNPIIQVGTDWEEALEAKTCVNLGNIAVESSPFQNRILPVLMAAFCSGVTAWLLLIVDYSWTWLKFVAIIGLHVCVFLMLLLPIWLGWQLGFPGRHLSQKKWDTLVGSVYNLGKFNVLQVCARQGNIFHFQGDISVINTLPLRAFGLFIAILTVVAYICQYSIIKNANNTQAVIWIACQAIAALARVLYWMIDPSFDDQDTPHAEYALLNNTCFQTLTAFELLAACASEAVHIPRWVYEYLTTESLETLLKTVTKKSPAEVVPASDEIDCYVLLSIDVGQIIARRHYRTKPGEQLINSWRLGFWRHRFAPVDSKSSAQSSSHGGATIHPFVLIKVPTAESDQISLTQVSNDEEKVIKNPNIDNEAWVQADPQRVVPFKKRDGWRIADTCNLFAVSTRGERIHLRSWQDSEIGHPDDCIEDCVFKKAPTSFFAHRHSWRYLCDRSTVLERLEAELQEFEVHEDKVVNTWGYRAWVSAKGGSVSRTGQKVRATGFVLLASFQNPSHQDELDTIRSYIK